MNCQFHFQLVKEHKFVLTNTSHSLYCLNIEYLFYNIMQHK